MQQAGRCGNPDGSGVTFLWGDELWEVPGQLGEQGRTSVRGCGRLRWQNTDPLPRRDSGSIPTPGTLPGNKGGAVKASPEESGVPGCGRWGSRDRGVQGKRRSTGGGRNGCRGRDGVRREGGCSREAHAAGPQGSRMVGPEPCPGMHPPFEDDM